MFYTWLATTPLFATKTQQLLWYYRILFQLKFIKNQASFKLKQFQLQPQTQKLIFKSGLFQDRYDVQYNSLTCRNVFKTKTNQKLEISLKNIKTPIFSNPKHTLHQTLHLFFLVSQTTDFQQFKPHAQFRLFWLQHIGGREFIFKPANFLRKWHNIHAFVYNSFYLNFLPLIFSSKFFKKETLALNWFFHPLSLSTWRFSSFFFTFYITIYSRKLSFFYKKLKHRGTSFALITDLEYHFRTLFYLRRNKWFTLALVPLNLNPWSVSLAIPTGTNNLFTQFFFYKFIVLIYKQATYNKHNLIKQIWFDYKNNF